MMARLRLSPRIQEFVRELVSAMRAPVPPAYSAAAIRIENTCLAAVWILASALIAIAVFVP